MNFTSLESRWTFCALVAALLFSTAETSAQFGLNQQRVSESQWRRGFHGFSMITEGLGLQTTNLQEFRNSDRQECLLIAMGKLDSLPLSVTDHVANGGAALLATDNSGVNITRKHAGFIFGELKSYPTERSSAFDGLHDCPVVTDFRMHPIVEGVFEIVTNNPGVLRANSRNILARLPANLERNGRNGFLAATQNRAGGRVVAIGDQSVFTNQMILFGDNALFANQAIDWLHNKKRTKVLMFVDGVEFSPLAPSDVKVDMPAPTRKEVMDALKNLPPAAMLEFANSVATVVEDEDMINSFVQDNMRKVPDLAFRQGYLFLIFGIACLTFVAAFLCQGKLQRQTATTIAVKRSQIEKVALKVRQADERQQAAHALLNRFCVDLANRRFSDWPSFPTGLSVDDDRKSKNLFKSMTKMSVLYKSKPVSYWTSKRLASLERTVAGWGTYFASRSTPVDSELLKHQDPWSTESSLE